MNTSYFIKTSLSPDGQYIISGSGDEFAYIWNTSKSGGPILKLTGHTPEVTCVAWCPIGETKVISQNYAAMGQVMIQL